jgi:hypothetical protein
VISENQITVIKPYLSEIKNSLGGSVGIEAEQLEFYFDEYESIKSEKYKFIYLVNVLDGNFSVYKIKLSSYIDAINLQDKFSQEMLANIKVEFLNLSFFQKNNTHFFYSETGEIISLQKHVNDFLVNSGENIEIKETLVYQDFFPLAIKVSIINPVERIFSVKLKFNVKSYLR